MYVTGNLRRERNWMGTSGRFQGRDGIKVDT